MFTYSHNYLIPHRGGFSKLGVQLQRGQAAVGAAVHWGGRRQGSRGWRGGGRPVAAGR